MKKKTITSVLVICIGAALFGCGKTTTTEETDPIVEVTEAPTEQKPDEIPAVVTEVAEKTGVDTKLDITSKQAINSFMNGDWRLTDTVTGEEYATLTISGSKECIFTRDTDGYSLLGTFDVSRHEFYDAEKDELISDDEYTGFELTFDGLNETYKLPASWDYCPAEETATGNFYISRGDGYDYMYLNWIGNGDSFIFSDVFQNIDRIRKEYSVDETYVVQRTWVFRRKNDGLKDTAANPDADFYGFVWNCDSEGTLWIQPMDSNTYEAVEEYVPRRFIAGYFTGKEDIGLSGYKLADDADISDVFHDKRLKSEYPCTMYSIKTNSEGKISELKEVDTSYYGIYDMGNARQLYDYDGMTFIINGFEYDLTDYDSPANAIMDMYQVGDWIVIEGHVNPHAGIYYLINVYTGIIEKTITGANLVWMGDDITTSVHSLYGELYNFKDHLIGTTDGTEIDSVSFDPDGRKVRVTDFNNNKYVFEIDNEDAALYKFADFQRNETSERWRDFMDEASQDAIAYVAVDPPYDTVGGMPYPVEIVTDTYGYVYIAALEDDTEIHIDYGNYDWENNRFDSVNVLDEATLDKGEARSYQVTVSEGIPSYCIFIKAGDRSGMFPVTMISGESDRCGTFVKAISK